MTEITLDYVFQKAGDNKELLKTLIEYIKTTFEPKEIIKEHPKYGLNLFYKKSGKSLAIVNLKDEELRAVVVIGPTLNEKFRDLKLNKEIKEMFENAKQYHDGRWLNIKIDSQETIEDLKPILLMKFKPSKNN